MGVVPKVILERILEVVIEVLGVAPKVILERVLEVSMSQVVSMPIRTPLR